MAKMNKENVMKAIITLVKNIKKEGNLNENLEAEFDFLYEEYEADKKNVTMEDLKHFVGQLKKEGYDLNTGVKSEVKENKNKKEVEEDMINLPEHKGNKSKNGKTIVKKETKAKNKVKNKNKVKSEPKREVLLQMTEIEEDFKMKPFPKTLKTELGNLKLRDDIETMEELAEIVESGEAEILFVPCWTAELLETYEYDPYEILEEDEIPEVFPNDVDLMAITFCTERVAYAVSQYTDVNTTFPATGFEPDENGLRNNGFLNYQIYELAD